MIRRRKGSAEYDERIRLAESEVKELKRRVQILETQTRVYRRKVSSVLATKDRAC